MKMFDVPSAVMVLLVVLIFVLPLLAALKKGARNAEKPKARRPLTPNEQKMFFRLVDAMPDLVVLPQVAFSALLTARSKGARNRFSQKVADFVLCDRAFNVLAIVELDDSSHNGRGLADKARDAMLEGAGYRVLRWRGIPDAAQVKAALAPVPKTTA